MSGAESTGPRVLSVSELTALLKDLIEGSVPPMWVRGEISNFKRHQPSGHLYFTLKDASCELRAVMWRRYVRNLRFEPADGMEVLCYGRVRVYQARGYYEFSAQEMEVRGLGALAAAFERLKRKLAEEGLFDEARKRPLPRFPHTVALVTASGGAALRDMLRTTLGRFPQARLLVYPVPVQGEGAAERIATAIDALNRHGEASVIVIGRGGGSLEDLWAFNEEAVARAVFASRIPVVSAVGHEVDYTISDFVADARAPTPTAAGQMVVPDQREIRDALRRFLRRARLAVRARLERRRASLAQLARRRVLRRPTERTDLLRRELDELFRRLRRDGPRRLERARQTTGALAGRLEAVSPLKTLARGYSITTPVGSQTPLKDAAEAPPGSVIETRLARGALRSRVIEIEERSSPS